MTNAYHYVWVCPVDQSRPDFQIGDFDEKAARFEILNHLDAVHEIRDIEAEILLAEFPPIDPTPEPQRQEAD